MDTFLSMTVFERVACHKRFSEAARELRMSATAVSRHVRQLEDHLGVKLLHRTTRQVTLTPDGAAALERIRQILGDVSELAAAVGGDRAPRGHLRVTAGVAVGHERLHRMLPAFLLSHPDVSVELLLTDRHVDLVADRIDLAIRVGRMADSGLVARRLAVVRHTLCAAPGHPPLAPEALLGAARIVDTNQGGGWRLRGPGGATLSVPAEGRYAVNSAHAALAACQAGLGVALLPDLVSRAPLAAGRLVAVMPGWEGEVLPLQAVYLERRHLSAAVRALVGWLSQAWDGYSSE